VNDCDPAIQGRALDAGSEYRASLPIVPAGSLTHCSLHWAAMPYGWAREAKAAGMILPYQVVADWDADGNAILVPGMSPALNAHDLSDDHCAGIDYCASVWRRNSRGVAVSISAMIDAVPGDFGGAPIDATLIEFLCAAAAALCVTYGIDARSREACYTHAEAAIWDGYFIGEDLDYRWDMGLLEPSTADVASLKRTASVTGNRLRERIGTYMEKLTVRSAHG